MSFINANIPPLECYVRSNFLQNRSHKFEKNDTYLPCVIIGVASVPHRAPLFHFVMEDGGLWWRMPIHAFCSKEHTPQEELYNLVLWDSFAPYIAVNKYDFLSEKVMTYNDRNRNELKGKYLFTLDWLQADANILDVGFSQIPGQHKCGHVIQLDNGNFAIQPNNRVKVFEPSFVTKWGKTVIDRKIGTEYWSVENQPRWILSDDDRFEYEMNEVKEENK
jgi:hypothetical protein